MELIKNTLDILDPSGFNSKKYLDYYNKLSDAEFNKKIKEFLNDKSENFYLEYEPFGDSKKDLKLNNIKRAADYLNIELDEYVNIPFMSNDKNNPIITPQKVPVGYIHVKRLQQILSKKNSFTIDISSRNMKTGQTTGGSKTGRVSDAENYALMAIESNAAVKEFMSSRADDIVMKQAMLKDINDSNMVSLENLPDSIENKKSLRAVDIYFLCAGLKTDLITNNLLLIDTIKNRQVKDTLKAKYDPETWYD